MIINILPVLYHLFPQPPIFKKLCWNILQQIHTGIKKIIPHVIILYSQYWEPHENFKNIFQITKE